MVIEPINIEQVLIALDRVDGTSFEKFFHAFYPAVAGDRFIPLGGSGDGGADAFQGESIVEGNQPGCYYQASVAEDHRKKIRDTVKRLREFGRNPASLIYVTSRRIKLIDFEESKLSQDLSVNVRIRDGSFIATQINSSSTSRAAFDTYLAPQLDFLRSVGNTRLAVQSTQISSPAIYVFLRQELERRRGKESLINALADGLIMWALEGTDPDQGKFLTKQQIIDKIEQAVPAARTILRGVIPSRLQGLSKEMTSTARPIRWHRKPDQYCLAYEHRKKIEADNAEDEALRIAVIDAFQTRLSIRFADRLSIEQRNLAVELSLQVIDRTFEEEGIELAAFIQRRYSRVNQTTLADHVDACLISKNVTQATFGHMKEAIVENLRGAFYDSTEPERLYFSKLSATYTLLFCLNTEPRVVEYFQGMASDFHLFVGSDIIVRVLSEKYLNPADQMMTNTLNIIRNAGGKLVLTEQVLEEIYTHTLATDYEFINKYRGIEHSINSIIARNSDRILIRAYYYARFSPPAGITGPADWQAFINQFCDYEILHRNEGREQIKTFLLAKFQMDFATANEIASLCDQSEVEQLAGKLQREKPDSRLAKNDALLTLAVYGRRNKLGEYSKVSEFGFRTWWLTGESRILRHTEDLVQASGARYMMRPEFILNFITLAPSTAEVRHTYRSIFPSVLGIQLARRVDPLELASVLDRVHEADQLEPARRIAVITQVTNTLKGDFDRPYNHVFQER